MTQLFNISVGGIDVTLRQSACNISEEMNRVYDVATFVLDAQTETILDQPVVINYGSKTFTGFVYMTGKTGKNAVSVTCRTNTAKLTEPYSPSEEAVDEASTSHALCALYSEKTGVPIVNLAADLDFGGSYERSGTMLAALTNIAAVTGAKLYDDNGTLTIAPNKAIDSEGVEIPEGDIFDFVADSKSVYNNGVGSITVQNGGSVETDIISTNNIYAEVDECSGELFVYTNPAGPIEESSGVSPFSAVVLERKEEYTLLDDDIVPLNAAIESIKSITLNGVSISNHNFEQGHNVLYFTTLMRGTLEVVYRAYAYKGYANIKQTPLGRFISFDLYYLDQILRFQGFLSATCANTMTDGDMTCITPSQMRYDAGFVMYTIGGVPDFTFYDKNVVIFKTVVSTPEDYISVENATLEETATGYRVKTRYPVDTALGAISSHAAVSYTISNDGEDYYFEFSSYYPDLLISYETAATKHTVQFAKITNGLVSMVVKNENTDQVCEYAITADIPCELNQSIYVDCAGQLSLEVTEIAGASLPVLDPNSTTLSVTVDVFGFVAVPVTVNGDYVINTGTLKDKTTITLTANV